MATKKKRAASDRQITSQELAARWKMNEGSIRMMRVNGTGPNFVKLGRGKRPRLRYWLSDIERFEREKWGMK